MHLKGLPMNSKKCFLTLILLSSLAGLPGYALAADTTAATNPPQTNTEPAIPDSELTTQVHDKLAADKVLAPLNLSVSCNKGIVTLKGKVASQAQLDQALNLAHSVDGVKTVLSQLVIGK